MSAIARLEVIPTRDGSQSEAVAQAVAALDEFDVSYETTPTDTVVEAGSAGEVFAAAEAAHRAVDDDRVITSLEVDEDRTRTQRGRDRVASVERRLGRPPKRERAERFERRERRTAERGTGDQPERYGGSRRPARRSETRESAPQAPPQEAGQRGTPRPETGQPEPRQTGTRQSGTGQPEARPGQPEAQTGQPGAQTGQSETQPAQPEVRESRYLGGGRRR